MCCITLHKQTQNLYLYQNKGKKQTCPSLFKHDAGQKKSAKYSPYLNY